MRGVMVTSAVVGVVLGLLALVIFHANRDSAVDYSSRRVEHLQLLGRAVETYTARSGKLPDDLGSVLEEAVVGGDPPRPLSSITTEGEITSRYQYSPQFWPGSREPFLRERTSDKAGRRFGLYEYGEVRECE